jgi:glutathione S-transferase
MNVPARRLHQFRFSNFNEKARWALAFKGLDLPRADYLPGPHGREIRKIAPLSHTPILEWDGAYVQGSAEVIDFLEQAYPDPALYPADPTEREQALALQAHFDEMVGPEARRALFLDTMDDAKYMAGLFAEGKPWLVRKSYGAMLPLVRPLMRSAMDLSMDKQPAALKATEDALDFVAEKSRETGYLVGDMFSVADLAAAALLSVTANPDHPDMKRPEPMSKTTRAWMDRWKDHPGTAWIKTMYAKHRAP